MDDFQYREVVDSYFAFRKYKEPGIMDALLFLLSEVGELVEAIDATCPGLADAYGVNAKTVLAFAKVMGEVADYVASQKGGWVRNNQPKAMIDLSGEVGDVDMMLEKLAQTLRLPTSRVCLLAKMARKGYPVSVEVTEAEE